MIQFSTYDETGAFVGTYEVIDANEILLNVPDGGDFMLGAFDPSSQYVRDGEVVDIPPRPCPGMTFDHASGEWVDARSPEDIAAEACVARAAMSCSRMQGILALGQDRWAQVLAFRDRPEATFGERAVIDEAAVWNRTSQTIALFTYLLDLSEDEVDELFITAMAIRA